MNGRQKELIVWIEDIIWLIANNKEYTSVEKGLAVQFYLMGMIDMLGCVRRDEDLDDLYIALSYVKTRVSKDLGK